MSSRNWLCPNHHYWRLEAELDRLRAEDRGYIEDRGKSFWWKVLLPKGLRKGAQQKFVYPSEASSVSFNRRTGKQHQDCKARALFTESHSVIQLQAKPLQDKVLAGIAGRLQDGHASTTDTYARQQSSEISTEVSWIERQRQQKIPFWNFNIEGGSDRFSSSGSFQRLS